MSAHAVTPGEDWVERVRSATDIVELVGQTVKLKRVGRNWVGLCPFHKEKTPSFSVHAERQFYHCFSCKAGGDAFKYVQETEKVGFREAVELLSRRAGIPIPERGRDAGASGRRARLLEALEAAARAYEQWLADPDRGAGARAALERRGVGREAQKAFRLGLAPPGWENLVQRLRSTTTEEVLLDAGLAARREGGRGLYDRFRNRLMIPLVAPGGAVVGFGARAIAAEDTPKYLNSPETPVYHKGQFLYGLDRARRAVDAEGEVVVVEGYFDAIALHEAGIPGTVATSGTALTTDQARLLRRLAPRVALTYDGDAAGQEAVMRSLGVLLADGIDVVVVDLPTGTDPDTLVRERGRTAWDEVRAQAADPVAFVQRHVLRRGGAGDPRERALQAIVSLAAGIADPIRLRLLLERAGQVFGLDPRVIQRAAALRRSGQTSEAPVRSALRERRGQVDLMERELIQSLLLAPSTVEEAGRWLVPADFEDPACARVATWLWEQGSGPIEDEAAASLARELLVGDDGTMNWEEEARGRIRRLRIRKLRRREQEIRRELMSQGGNPDVLMREGYEIAQSLKELTRS